MRGTGRWGRGGGGGAAAAMAAALPLGWFLVAAPAPRPQDLADAGPPSAPERPEYAINAKGAISGRGLVGAWRGDGDARDRSGGGSHGALHGGVTFVPAMVGRGFRFDGVDGGLNLPDTNPLKIGGSMTVAAWIHIESFPRPEQGAAMILFRGDDRSGFDPYHLQIDSSRRLRFAVEDGTAGGVDLGAPIGAGRFVHVAATLDVDSGRLRLYENGEVVAETTTSVRPMRELDPGANPGVGIGNHGGRPGSPHRYPFHGVINELLLYGRALSAAEIRALVRDRTDVPALADK